MDEVIAADEARLLDAAVRLSPTLGWGGRLVQGAAQACGLSPAETALLLPAGARDLAALLWKRHDGEALSQLARTDPLALKVRERIRIAVDTRVEVAAGDAEAERKASAFLALPHNLALTTRLAWSTADGLWRWAGGAATDENHYSKRAILAGVLVSTAMARMSGGRERATAHLDAQIGRVMAFERWKGGLPRAGEVGARVAQGLGRLRYGRDH